VSKWGQNYSRINSFRRKDFWKASIQLPWYRDFRGREFVQWIFDSQDLTHPEYFSNEEVSFRRMQIQQTINRNCSFYFSSWYQESLFQKSYPSAVSVGVMHFTYYPKVISANFEWDCKHCNDGNFFYLPNQWWAHKNHISVIEAFQQYKMGGGKNHLVLTGDQRDYRWPNLEPEILSKLQGCSDTIHNLGFIDRADTNFLFEKCHAVLQPSSSEGWSTSVEASIRFNKLILANDIAVHREQALSYPNVSFFDVAKEPSIVHNLFQADKFRPPLHPYDYKIRERRFQREILSVIRNVEKLFIF